MEQIRTLSADKAVRVFSKKLESCRKFIPRRKVTNRTVPWWNPELTDLRKKVTSAKKQLLRARKLATST